MKTKILLSGLFAFIFMIFIIFSLTNCKKDDVAEDTTNYFTDEYYNLDDNLVPLGWQFTEVLSEVNFINGKLTAQIVDSEGYLGRDGIVPPGTTKMKFEWDGSLQNSYWGMFTQLQIDFGTNEYFTISAQLAGVNNSISNRIYIVYYQGSTRNVFIEKPIEPINDNYHFIVELLPTSIIFSASSISSGTTYFNESSNIPENVNFSFDDVNSIKFRVNTTTDNICWLDNITVNVIP
jgi:hypothetical protein